jgi:hypothetical protein
MGLCAITGTLAHAISAATHKAPIEGRIIRSGISLEQHFSRGANYYTEIASVKRSELRLSRTKHRNVVRRSKS